jgi:sulfur-oxidizing protein SoxX
MAFMLLNDYIWANNISGNRVLTNRSPNRPRQSSTLASALIAVALPAIAASAQSSVTEGRKLAFDRAKGNCLSCHEIKGGDLSGTIGPALKDIKHKFPNRKDLIAILTDETQRNPQTAMPPFGRNHILTEQEIDAIVDFLETL